MGFAYGWKLTLVILAISPLLAGAAMVMTKVGTPVLSDLELVNSGAASALNYFFFNFEFEEKSCHYSSQKYQLTYEIMC